MVWNTETYPAQFYGYYVTGKSCRLELDEEWVNAQEVPGKTLIFLKRTVSRGGFLNQVVPKAVTVSGKRIDQLVADAIAARKLSFSVAAHKQLIDDSNAATAKVYANAKTYTAIADELEATVAELRRLGFIA